MPQSTKALMIASAALMLLIGLPLTFAPDDVLTRAGGERAAAMVLLLQAAGALYLGFAILNWMAKDNLIGGIYSRPVAMGNFLHFFVLAAALLKAVAAGQHAIAILVLCAVYVLFTAWFGLVAFTSPVSGRKTSS